MKATQEHSERLSKLKFLEFLQRGTNYKPFEGYVKEPDDHSYNFNRSGNISGSKVEDLASSSHTSKRQVFQPYYQERDNIGKIINDQNSKPMHLDLELEKKISQFEQYKRKIHNKKMMDTVESVKNFKIDTASPLTPRNQPIQKNGKLLFDKGLKQKAKLLVQTKKNSILASISSLSQSFSSHNISIGHHINHFSHKNSDNKRTSIEAKFNNSLEQLENQSLLQINQNQNSTIIPPLSSTNSYRISNTSSKNFNTNGKSNVDSNQHGITKHVNKLVTKRDSTLDNSLEEENDTNSSTQKIRKQYYQVRVNLTQSGEKNNNNNYTLRSQLTGNNSNRSMLLSTKNDESKSALSTSKFMNTSEQQLFENKQKQSQKLSNNNLQEGKQQQSQQSGQVKQDNEKEDLNSQQVKRPLFPPLSVKTDKNISTDNSCKDDQNHKSKYNPQNNLDQSVPGENQKDYRTLYQINVPHSNETGTVDISDMFYCHDHEEMVPFDSFKKYKYNDPKSRLKKYLTLSEKVKQIQEKKEEHLQNSSINNNTISSMDHNQNNFIHQIVPPVGTYQNNYNLIDRRVPTFRIKPEHSQSDRSYYLKKQLQESQQINSSQSNFIKKPLKTDNEDEGFEKMYSDIIKSIQSEVQEQIQKCGERYLHPDGDLQLQKHLSIEDISKVDQKFKLQAKQLKDRLNKMKAYLAFYQYQV